MTVAPSFTHFRNSKPTADQFVTLQAGDVLPISIGVVYNAQMDAVHLIEVTVDVAAKDDFGHLVLFQPDLLFQLAEQGVHHVLSILQMTTEADAGLALQTLFAADPGRHEEAPGGLVLHQHIRNQLFEGRVAFRLTAELGHQVVKDDPSEHGIAVLILLDIPTMREAFVL